MYGGDTAALLREAARIEGSEENQGRRETWESSAIGAHRVFKGAPADMVPRAGRRRRIPFTVDFDMPLWADLLGFSLRDYFQDPETYLRAQLAIRIFRHRELGDDTYVDRRIDIWLGITMENSLFGLRSIFPEDDSPWSDPHPLIEERSDIERLPPVDFRRSGLMPRVLGFYEKIEELCGNDFTVGFDWRQGPFGIARFLRGYENILVDTLQNPSLVHRLMGVIVEACESWHQAKSAYLGKPVERNILGNDDIGSPSISPWVYEQLILPYEQELSRFYGGLLYWHSCGDVTPLLPAIRKIQDIEVFHVGPWTDVRKAREVFCPRTALEICLNPVEILDGSRASMGARLEQILRLCADDPITIRNDCMSRGSSLTHIMEQMRSWIETARDLLG
jgi:uroporphyrinogen-III decarboxylase